MTGPVQENYSRLREASSDYGEFKSLVAQEVILSSALLHKHTALHCRETGWIDWRRS